MGKWFLSCNEKNPDFLQGMFLSDEANTYINGEVNKQNTRYWSQVNPLWYS
jgi:hypothetical protein